MSTLNTVTAGPPTCGMTVVYWHVVSADIFTAAYSLAYASFAPLRK